MKSALAGKLGSIAVGVAVSSLFIGWLGVAGALPGPLEQPFAAIADVVTDPTAPSDPTTTVGEPTTTVPGDPTTTVPGDPTTTTVPSDPTTTSTTVPGDDDQDPEGDGPSEHNCGRFHAGTQCQRPVTPGWAREDHHDHAHGPAPTTVPDSTVTTTARGTHDDD